MSKKNETPKQQGESEDSGLSFSFDDIETVHEQLQETSQEPNRAAIDAAQDEETAELREQSSNVDSEGTVFNPDLHAVNRDGDPSLTPTGKFRKKRGASKVAAKSDAAKTIEQENAARAAGCLAADMLITSGVNLLGPEWAPLGNDGQLKQVEFDEHSNLRKAFGDYFVARGISDFPPGIALTIAVSSYAAPRLAAGKETKTRLAKAKLWVVETVNKISRKRKGKKNAQSDSRDNDKRKNDAGKEAVQPELQTGTRHPRT